MMMNRSYAISLNRRGRNVGRTTTHAGGILGMGLGEKKYGWCDKMDRIFNVTPQQSVAFIASNGVVDIIGMIWISVLHVVYLDKNHAKTVDH
jgi:hypothetical protein